MNPLSKCSTLIFPVSKNACSTIEGRHQRDALSPISIERCNKLANKPRTVHEINRYDLRRIAESVESTVSTVDYPTVNLVKNIILTAVSSYLRGRKIRTTRGKISATAWALDKYISTEPHYPATSKIISKLHQDNYQRHVAFNTTVGSALRSGEVDGGIREYPLMTDGGLTLATEPSTGTAYIRFGEQSPIPFTNFNELYYVLSLLWEGAKKAEEELKLTSFSEIEPTYALEVIQQWTDEISDGLDGQNR